MDAIEKPAKTAADYDAEREAINKKMTFVDQLIRVALYNEKLTVSYGDRKDMRRSGCVLDIDAEDDGFETRAEKTVTDGFRIVAGMGKIAPVTLNDVPSVSWGRSGGGLEWESHITVCMRFVA